MASQNPDLLRECRAHGTLAGMASGGVAFGAYFMAQIFDITRQHDLFSLDIVGGFLVVSIFATAFGGGGLFGRWMGEKVIYPVRVGNDRSATKVMWGLAVAGILVPALVFGIIAFIQSLAKQSG